MTRVVVLASVTLIRLPTLFNRTEDPIAWSLSLAPFWIVIVKRLFLEPHQSGRPVHLTLSLREGVPALAFIGLILVSFPRAASSGAIQFSEAFGHMLLWVTVTLFGFAVFLTRPDGMLHQTSELRALVIQALGIYVVINAVLLIAGIESAKQIYVETRYRPATVLGIVGVQAERTLFPMAAGIASFGIVAGASLVAVILGSAHSDSFSRRIWGLTIVLASVYAILATDARSAMLYAVISLGVVLLVPRIMGAVSGGLPLVALLLPALLVVIAPRLSPLEQAQLISRSGADLATLNSRTYVWGAGLAQAETKTQGTELMIGYGFEGQYTSRVSELYRIHFQTFVNPLRIGLHNAVLQYIIDIGIIGAVLFLIAFSRLLKALSHIPGNRAVFGVTIYLLLAGTTDSVPTPYTQELFMAFVLLLMSAGAASRSSLTSSPGEGTGVVQTDGSIRFHQ